MGNTIKTVYVSAVDNWLKIAKEFEKCWNFLNCVGAIDGKHIAIQCPSNLGSGYFNDKEHHSIVF